MTRKGLASTALFVAAVRARESRRKDGLFRDELSSLLAGREGMAKLASSERNPESNYHKDSFPYLEVRTRYFDDWLLGATVGSGARQVVLLGAGMDTRAFRVPWPKGTELWEVDTPELFALKEPRLREARAKPACQRTIVETDLSSKKWAASLRHAGFEEHDESVWLAEGLFQYLTARGVDQILESAASLSIKGSAFGAEVISRDYITRVSNRADMLRRRDSGTPWTFGSDNPEELFLAHGWSVDEKATAKDAAVELGRWSARGEVSKPPGAMFVSAAKE